MGDLDQFSRSESGLLLNDGVSGSYLDLDLVGCLPIMPLIRQLPKIRFLDNSWLSASDPISGASIIQQRLESKHDGAL
jgi:hypothetical protein